MTLTKLLAATSVSALALGASSAMADAIIFNTGADATADLALGLRSDGALNLRDPFGAVSTINASGNFGIAAKGIDGGTPGAWYDATAPGCLCEGWGVSGTVGGAVRTGGASVSNPDPGNLTIGAFATDAAAGTGSFATSSVSLTNESGFKIVHDARASDVAPGQLFEMTVTISNMTGSTIEDLRYTRVMDWDIPLTEFNEFVTIGGTGTTTFLERSHDNGFANVNPLASTSALLGGTTDVDFTDSGPADHGAYFLFNFGDLLDGEDFSFTIYYGAANSEAEADNALGLEGIELFSYGQSNGGGFGKEDPTFIFGFKGVGGTAVIPPPPPPPPTPTGVSEPGALGLVGLGLLGAGLATRRRRRS